jgi:hypothetical protein
MTSPKEYRRFALYAAKGCRTKICDILLETARVWMQTAQIAEQAWGRAGDTSLPPPQSRSHRLRRRVWRFRPGHLFAGALECTAAFVRANLPSGLLELPALACALYLRPALLLFAAF